MSRQDSLPELPPPRPASPGYGERALPARPAWQSIRRGLRGRCPNCDRGNLFRAFLKVADRCGVCGEAFHHHRADDAPAYFVILIVGHVVVPLALVVEVVYAPPYWLHAVLWLPLTIGLAVGLLQPVKGAIVGWQWANYMHGFDPHARDDTAADPLEERF
jgi:uncharacterized protein (DUF983 family)